VSAELSAGRYSLAFVSSLLLPRCSLLILVRRQTADHSPSPRKSHSLISEIRTRDKPRPCSFRRTNPILPRSLSEGGWMLIGPKIRYESIGRGMC